jgi:Uma2 family endonuclease
MQQAATIFTYDDYLTLPNDGKRYEIIDGDLLVTPAPSTEHQEILGNLYAILRAAVSAKDIGKIFCAPIDVVLSMTEVVQPDIVGVSRERLQIITKKNIVAAPDLVVEILSEATAKTDRTTKKQVYERHGVREYWIVDPERRTIEVYILKGSSFASAMLAYVDGSVRSEVFPNLPVDVKEVFKT